MSIYIIPSGQTSVPPVIRDGYCPVVTRARVSLPWGPGPWGPGPWGPGAIRDSLSL